MNDKVLEQATLAVEGGRIKVWDAIHRWYKSLTPGLISEVDAIHSLNCILDNYFGGRYWYNTGSQTGYRDLYRGTIVVFGTDDDIETYNFRNARLLVPRTKIKWNGLVYVYASPLVEFFTNDNTVGVIAADFGVTISDGRCEQIKQALSSRRKLQNLIMTDINRLLPKFSNEVFERYSKNAAELRLTNIAQELDRKTNGSGSFNIGHCLPILLTGKDDWYTSELNERYASMRKFISSTARTDITDALWTLESRDITPYSPYAVSFHEVIAPVSTGWHLLASSAQFASLDIMKWLS